MMVRFILKYPEFFKVEGWRKELENIVTSGCEGHRTVSYTINSTFTGCLKVSIMKG